MMTTEQRIAADRLWRDPAERKAFEAETGLTDEGTQEYDSRFIEWALAKLKSSPACG